MKKLVFVNRYFFPDESATSQILADLVFHLAEKQGIYDIVVIAGRQLVDDPHAALVPSERVRKVQVYRPWSSRWGRRNNLGRALDSIVFFFGVFWRLVRLARKGDVIVVKTDPPLVGLIGAIAARIRGAKLVNWVARYLSRGG